MVRDQYISSKCQKPEGLFLGDFHMVEGHAELRFEGKPCGAALLSELLWRTFGCYAPLKPESARIYERNPIVSFGEQTLGTLREIVAEFPHNWREANQRS